MLNYLVTSQINVTNALAGFKIKFDRNSPILQGYHFAKGNKTYIRKRGDYFSS